MRQSARAPQDPRQRPPVQTASFTLVEVVIALMIVMFVVGNVAAVQGNAIVFSDYGKNSTQASWLARRVMSQVEYYWRTKPFPELETNLPDQKFEDVEGYLYSLEIKEWKFPFTKLLTMAMGGGMGGEEGESEEEAKPEAAASGMLEQVVKQVFGDEPIFMTAHVDVSWAEGATRNSTGLTYLLTNQAKLDQALVALKPVYDKLTKPKEPEKRPGTTGGPGGPTPAGPGKRPPSGPGGGGRPPGGGRTGGGGGGDGG